MQSQEILAVITQESGVCAQNFSRVTDRGSVAGASNTNLGSGGMASEQGTVSKRMYPSGRSQAQVEQAAWLYSFYKQNIRPVGEVHRFLTQVAGVGGVVGQSLGSLQRKKGIEFRGETPGPQMGCRSQQSWQCQSEISQGAQGVRGQIEGRGGFSEIDRRSSARESPGQGYGLGGISRVNLPRRVIFFTCNFLITTITHSSCKLRSSIIS